MALKPISEAEIIAQQAELKAKLMPAADVSLTNEETVARLSQVSSFQFPQESGIWYDVPRVPYYDGMRLNDIYMSIRNASKDHKNIAFAAVGVYDVMLREVLTIGWTKLVVPRSRVKRLLKRLRLLPNPFVKMSEQEIAELLAFFLIRRMASNVSFHYPTGLKVANQ